MNRIRISNLLAYYRTTLGELVDECYRIKNDYTEGKVSYNRANRALCVSMKRACERLRLCNNLSDMLGYSDAKVIEYKQDLAFLTDWALD